MLIQFDALETRINAGDCLIGAHIPQGEIVRAIFGHSAVLHCNQYGQPAPSVKWFVYPNVFIGSYDPQSKKGSLATDMAAKYDILPGSFSFL